MTDLIALKVRPPRLGGDVWLVRHRRIGLLIDWLDSRPEHADADAKALQRKAGDGDPVALAAGIITKRIAPHLASLDGPVDHASDYRVYYHSEIAGYLDASELALGEETYHRLHSLDAACISGLFNLAELERRRGHVTDAHALLKTALDVATARAGSRYGIPDEQWTTDIRCAIARLAGEVGDGRALLGQARREALGELVAAFKAYGAREATALVAHQAFSVADAEQRIVLHAAMRLAAIRPLPPPAAHAQFESIHAVDELVRQHKQARGELDGPTPPPPGPAGSMIVKFVGWLAGKRNAR